MKAIVHSEYGTPDVLRLQEVDNPVPKDREVLVRVHAASVNPLDWHFLTGTPYLLRMMGGPRKPTDRVRGVDVAGRVEAVGKDVQQFHPGDDVFGTGKGAFAEYICVPQDRIVPKPSNLTFEQAAAVPVAGITALQGLRAGGPIEPGQSVLINGAAGGVGTFAVQIARSLGAEVTGVCSTKSVELVRSIGATRVIDYTREDFAAGRVRYDRMLDAVGNRSLTACWRVLKPKGVYATVAGGKTGNWIAPLAWVLKVLLASLIGRRKTRLVMTKSSREDLLVLKGLLETGKITPVIDRRFTSLSEVPDLLRHQGAGHARGKSVVSICSPE